MSNSNDEHEMHQPCDEWQELMISAHTAGRESARRLALRYSAQSIDCSGSVDVRIEPFASPVAAWLHNTGRAVITENDNGVLTPITISPADLHPVEDAESKAHSPIRRSCLCHCLLRSTGR